MFGQVPGVPRLSDDHRAEIHTDIGALHSFVDLFERVHALRLWRLGLLAALNIADCATTVWFLHRGGAEANPFFAPIVHAWWAPLIVKTIIFVFVARAVLRSPTRARRVDRLLVSAVAYYLAVVGWNLWIVTQL